MSTCTEIPLTSLREAQFFLAPEKTLHRQYEALRAHFVDRVPGPEVAARFGYSPGSFRVLCHRFRHEYDLQEHFFKDVARGPQAPPKRDQLRLRVVAMRKRNLSVYDIQRELQEEGHEISITSLGVLLQEEGFARLPRRRDDERPEILRPEEAAVADIRELDLSARRFRTRAAGLFIFVPLMEKLDLAKIARQAGLPGSQMVPAEQALRSILALKLLGRERKSHVMDLVLDQGLAIFAGLNAIPKRSYLAAYSSSVDREVNIRLMESWFKSVEKAGIERSGSIDVDFHTVPANSAMEPLEKHYVSSRSRRQKGILVFLARDAEERVLCYSNAAVSKEEQADEILRFVAYWKRKTGSMPDELVFDSQLTTHANCRKLADDNITFITLRRRSKRMLARIYGLPSSAWRRVTLKSLTRTYRNPKVLDERIYLKGYGMDKKIRQITVTELGHEEPTILLTNDLKRSPAALITRYAQRMLIENGISEAIQFFHIDALSSMVGLKVDFDLQITLMASSLYRLFAARLPTEYRRSHAKTLFNSLLDVGGLVEVTDRDVIVTLDKRARNPYLVSAGFPDHSTKMTWFGGKRLRLQFQ